MTVLETAAGLVLHSPVEFRPDLAEQLADLGPVRSIVVPSVLHDLYLGSWFRRCPEARVFAARGLRKPLPPHSTLPDEWPADLGEEIEVAAVRGMPRVNETVLFHRPSRSLIVADLLFNLHSPVPPLGRVLLRALGVYRKTAASRLFRLLIRDRDAFAASLGRILEWDFAQIVVGHGEIVETHARRRLEDAFALRGRQP
jgi:glyoxylase-like metal-dependent hydrolase (beta-lactamase superfamily II)